MRNFTQHLALPVISLALLFTAAGSALTVGTNLSRTESKTASVPSAKVSLADFCDQYWGELDEHGHYCRFAQWFHLNLSHVGGKPVLTGIAVLPGDTLRVEARNIPEALVGGKSYDASEDHVIAKTGGYLEFRAVEGQHAFSVDRVGVERCYADAGGKLDTVACPSQGQRQAILNRSRALGSLEGLSL